MTRFITILFCLLITNISFAKDIKIVTTIKPIHSLVKHIIDEKDTASSMIDGNYTPHNFALKPSYLRKVYHSDAIILIDRNFETFMRSSFKVIPDSCKVISLSQTTDLKLEKLKSHNKETQQIDYHIWLSPKNAIKIVEYLNLQLSQLNPSKSKVYQKNTISLVQKLNKLDTELMDELSPVSNVAFMVFHNAYQYFIKGYTLNYKGAITQNPNSHSSIKKIQQTQKDVQDHQIKCVFKEPQYQNKMIETVIQDANISIGELDPLGSNIKAGKSYYFKLMHNLAKNLRTCLDNK